MTNANTAPWISSAHPRKHSLDHHLNLQNLLSRGGSISNISIQGHPSYGQPFSRSHSCDCSMQDPSVKNSNAIQGIARKALHGLGALTHTHAAAGAASSSSSSLLPPLAQTNESNSESVLSSEMRSQILSKTEEARKKFHETVLNMEAGSQEWRQMQHVMRESKTITNVGLSMAMNCRFMDDFLDDCMDNSKNADRTSSPRSTAPSSVSASDLDRRRHLIRRESLELIRQQPLTITNKEENKQGAAQWVRGAGGNIRNLMAKTRVLRRSASLPRNSDLKPKQSMESPLCVPRRRRRLSSLPVVDSQYGPTSAAPGETRQEEWKVVERSNLICRLSRGCSLGALPPTRKSAGLPLAAANLEDSEAIGEFIVTWPQKDYIECGVPETSKTVRVRSATVDEWCGLSLQESEHDIQNVENSGFASSGKTKLEV
jgi:hypothetical protein